MLRFHRICIYRFRVLEDLKIPPFSLQVSLTRASSLINESQRSHLETPNRNRSKENVDSANAMILSTCMSRIQKSTDIMAAEAEKLFYDCEYKKSFKILNEYGLSELFISGA